MALPVSQAQVLLESGVPELDGIIYSFSAAAQATSAVDGTFQLCAPALSISAALRSTVLVVTALDRTGKAYPTYATNRLTSANLGVIFLGGCNTLCAEGQSQTSAPATIAGTITTDPTAKTVTVTPHYAINAPDGSGHLWSLLVPPLNPAQSFALQTAPGTQAGCAGQSSPCASYSFVLPSQKPVLAGPQGSTEQAGAPVYSVAASIAGTPSCTPPSMTTSLQEDGATPLLAAPGAQLTAEPIHFKTCR